MVQHRLHARVKVRGRGPQIMIDCRENCPRHLQLGPELWRELGIGGEAIQVSGYSVRSPATARGSPEQLAVDHKHRKLQQPPAFSEDRGRLQDGARAIHHHPVISQQQLGTRGLDQEAEVGGQVAGLEQRRGLLVVHQLDCAAAEQGLDPPRLQPMLGGEFGGTSEELTGPVAITEPDNPGLHDQGFAADLRVGCLLGKLDGSGRELGGGLDAARAVSGVGQQDQRTWVARATRPGHIRVGVVPTAEQNGDPRQP